MAARSDSAPAPRKSRGKRPKSSADGVRAFALALPEAVEEETWSVPTFRVRKRIFAIMAGDGRTVSVKATREEQALMLASDPETFSYADYVGRFGWVTVRLETVEPPVLKAILTGAWMQTAPKRVVKAYESVGETAEQPRSAPSPGKPPRRKSPGQSPRRRSPAG
jgi:hypothetical protein